MKQIHLFIIASVFLISFHSQAGLFGWFKGSGYSDDRVEKEMARTPRLYEAYVQQFKESDFITKEWYAGFKYVVVINKAAQGLTAQTIRVYDNQQLIMSEKISTGREQFEMKRRTTVNHGPDNSYWSMTPTGYYTPMWLSRDHKSKSWRTEMPYAMFFDIKNGLALHEVPPKAAGALGYRASGGCIRQPAYFAKMLFEMVEQTQGSAIPKFNVDGLVERTENGEIVYTTRHQLATGQTFPTYSVLLIIQDVVD